VAAGPAVGSPATALIVAAGSGDRLGAGGPKALVEVAGRPMYEYSLDACLAAEQVSQVVIAVPPGRGADFRAAAGTSVTRSAGPGESREARPAGNPTVRLVEGGATRSESVAAALALVETDLVLVHDAARPLVTPGLIDDAVAALSGAPGLDGVIAAAPVTDTVKQVTGDGRVVRTLDRSELVAVQTPQVFRRAALAEAIASGDPRSATDDASLIEADGGAVGVLAAPSFNIKVTVLKDILLAEALLAERN
jgi:2-C-methyl-D-erythritol 4-phosphate cytidylyltransferase